MRSSVGRALAGAAGLVVLLAPSASAGWWDGGYGAGHAVRRNRPPGEQPAPGCGQPSPCGRPTAPAPAPVPAPPIAPPGSIYGCENSDLPGTKPLLHKETTPAPGTPVRPGDVIVVEITWQPSDWVAPDLHKALDCVYVDNRYVPELSGGERPTPNDGHFEWRYVVPADLPAGATICDQGFVSGPNGEEDYGRETSNIVCFPVGSPPPAAAPAPPTTARAELPPQGERIDQQLPLNEAPPVPELPQPQAVLPRTGDGPGGARLAAQA